MDSPATTERDHIRNGLGLLNIDDPEFGWDDPALVDTRPRRVPGVPNGAMAMPTLPRVSIGSVPSPEGGSRSPSWSTDTWMPSPDLSSSARPAQPRFLASRAQRRPSTGRSTRTISASNLSQYSLYPAPTKPLPPIPPPRNHLQRLPSADSNSRSSISTTRSSRSNGTAAYLEPNLPSRLSVSTTRSSRSTGTSAYLEPILPSPTTSASPAFVVPDSAYEYQPFPERTEALIRRPLSQRSTPRTLNLHFWKDMVSEDKKVNNSVHYLDISPTTSILVSKHGNNLLKVWSLASGELQSTIKFSSYTEARSRSRDYLIRSHAILSESSTLVAVATRFGRSIEIFNWAKKKSIQSISDVDRWTAGRFEIFDGGRCPLAVYRAESAKIDLYLASKESKKPLYKQRAIELSKAGLPFIPVLPELAISATSPLVVAAAGPRPPIAGHPPSKRETLLVAWETSASDTPSHKPYRVARPWQHEELDTAIPCDLVTYGSFVVSIWIPASFRAVPVPTSRKGSGYNLARVTVPLRYVLVWDLSANSTRTIAIPNCTSCISPDCRLVAYCDASGSSIGARGSLVIIDVISGDEVWCWPDKNAVMVDSGDESGFGQFDDLGSVNELAFSADGRFLILGDGQGRMGVYDVRT